MNIHGTHYVMIQNNVIYDIMGGAVFLEDGIEIGNTFDVSILTPFSNACNLVVSMNCHTLCIIILIISTFS